ncbi:Tubulin polyglutamylase ttll-4 [Tritrichomonas foetus]|uniref:Tubulin--tyrosine ligase-like protein 5 n=1 Tax=Tritrichomonas foetus TaxID=1144522 RepID=A0A1J4K2T3_9EUKA|nr:Tubulin polyglutamylase ttll-4 [Tritrichomonas foetus]|eukprot:OHT05753.1 Tubulin polyglutamylase ttll-4 [Tritrichomonas foetus]
MATVELKFAEVPLPYHYISIPPLGYSSRENDKTRILFAHKVITKLTAQTFRNAGFAIFEKPEVFNASWGRQFHAPQYLKCEPWQKINHFAGAFLMGRKDNFHKRMTELRKRIGTDADFYPVSFHLPGESDEANLLFKSHELWIFKPWASSRGRGIRLISSSESKLPTTKGIIQYYIERPLLITGRKFDIRLYVLVTSITPLKIYMHDSGLGRFATHQYEEDGDASDLQMHLTNYSVNKLSDDFVSGDSEKESIDSSKWSLPFLLNYLESMGIDTEKIMKSIEKVTIGTIIAGVCGIRPHHLNLIDHRHTSYEMYGIDILLDEKLNPYVMEINISPSMNGDSKLDQSIKKRLLHDLIQMARIIDCNPFSRDPCPGIRLYDQECRQSLTTERINDVVNKKVNPWDSPIFLDYRIVRDFVEEKEIQTGFRRIFPKRKTMDDFYRYFDKVIYDDIVLHDYVSLSKEERYGVLTKSWEVYSNSMSKINKSVRLIQEVLEEEEEEYLEEEEEEEEEEYFEEQGNEEYGSKCQI